MRKSHYDQELGTVDLKTVNAWYPLARKEKWIPLYFDLIQYLIYVLHVNSGHKLFPMIRGESWRLTF